MLGEAADRKIVPAELTPITDMDADPIPASSTPNNLGGHLNKLKKYKQEFVDKERSFAKKIGHMGDDLRRVSIGAQLLMSGNEKADKLKREALAVMRDESGAAMLALTGYLLSIVQIELIRRDHETFNEVFDLNGPNNSPEPGFFTPNNCDAARCIRFINTTMTIRVIKIVVTILTAILLGLTFQKRYFEYKIEIDKGMLPRGMPFFASAEFYYAILEAMLFILHPIPYLDAVMEFSQNSGIRAVYTLDEIIVSLMWLRLYTLLPLMQRYVGLHSIKAQLAAKLNQVKITTPFTFKAMLKDHPCFTIIAMFSVVTIWMSHTLTMAERGTCGDMLLRNLNETEHQNEICPFGSFPNALWNIIITATTVGYGDIYPITDCGRTVAIFAAFVGTVVISILVTVIDQNSKFEIPEDNVLRLIKKDDAEVYGRNLAASRVQCAWVTFKIRKTGSITPWAKLKKYRAYSKLSHVIQDWREFSRRMKYHFHYSFLETHMAEQQYIHRIAVETCDLMKTMNSSVGTDVVQNIARRRSSSPSGPTAAGMEARAGEVQSLKQQMAALEDRQAAMQRQMTTGFSRMESAIGKLANANSRASPVTEHLQDYQDI